MSKLMTYLEYFYMSKMKSNKILGGVQIFEHSASKHFMF